MKRSLIHTLIAGFVVLFGLSFVASAPVGAVNVVRDSCRTNPDSAMCQNAERDNEARTNRLIANVTNALMIILGVIAVVTIIIGGITYVTANGEASRIKRAKDIIIYAVVGLVIAIMAWGIVRFVLTAFGAL